MATYTAILDTQLDPDAPLTSLLMYQLRDNALAIGEGASGAPRIVSGALNTSVATQAYSFGGGGGSLTVTLNPQSFFPANTGFSGTFVMANGGTVDAPKVNISSSGGASGNITWRYIAP